MDKQLLNELYNVTGYNFENYINDINIFIENDYPELLRYWATISGNINSDILERFRKLNKQIS